MGRVGRPPPERFGLTSCRRGRIANTCSEVLLLQVEEVEVEEVEEVEVEEVEVEVVEVEVVVVC